MMLKSKKKKNRHPWLDIHFTRSIQSLTIIDYWSINNSQDNYQLQSHLCSGGPVQNDHCNEIPVLLLIHSCPTFPNCCKRSPLLLLQANLLQCHHLIGQSETQESGTASVAGRCRPLFCSTWHESCDDITHCSSSTEHVASSQSHYDMHLQYFCVGFWHIYNTWLVMWYLKTQCMVTKLLLLLWFIASLSPKMAITMVSSSCLTFVTISYWRYIQQEYSQADSLEYCCIGALSQLLQPLVGLCLSERGSCTVQDARKLNKESNVQLHLHHIMQPRVAMNN